MEEKSRTIYKCPYCSNKYDSWDDANECAIECVDVDSPEEDEEVLFICEYCRKEFNEEEEAEGCEENHAEKNDTYYSQFKLKGASEHPAQSKLECVLSCLNEEVKD